MGDFNRHGFDLAAGWQPSSTTTALVLIVVIVVALISVAIATPWIARLAIRLGAVDNPGGRRVHSQSTPRMGGLAIAIGAVLGISTVLWIPGIAVYGQRPLIAVFIATCAMLVLGFFDDWRQVPHLRKLFIQIALAAFCWFNGVRIHALCLPFAESIPLNSSLAPLLTIIWIVGVTNAINLLDGLDGLAAGVVAIVSTTLLLIGFLGGPYNIFLMAASGAIAASCVGFLLYNSHPARIFMGDTGSLFLGFLIANIAILSSQKSTTATALGIPILALGVPIADTLIAIIRRLINGRSPFVADRHHLHHVLYSVGVKRGFAVAVIYCGTGVLCVFALLAVIIGQSALLFGMAVLITALVGLYIRVSRGGHSRGGGLSNTDGSLPDEFAPSADAL